MTPSHPFWAREITRRKFITGLAAFSAVAAGTAAGIWRVPDLDRLSDQFAATRPMGWVAIGSLDRLEPGIPLGVPLVRRIRDGWVEALQSGIAYAVTHDGRTVQVLSNICTHGGCRVTWQLEQRAFVCPCHEGLFGADGAAIAGLPTRSLEQLPSRVVDGQVQMFLET